MQIFLDSADPKEIAAAWTSGLIEGVTTNPSTAAKQKKPYKKIVQEILKIVGSDASISLEVIADEVEDIVTEARILSELDPRVVVKIPCTKNGLTATWHLSREGILVNSTLIFSPVQALLAAKAGAYYISVFVGRLNDVEYDAGLEVVAETVKIMELYDYQSRVLYASVRSVADVNKAALIGADIVTVPYNVFTQLANHPLTTQGLDKFKQDWKNAKMRLPV